MGHGRNAQVGRTPDPAYSVSKLTAEQVAAIEACTVVKDATSRLAYDVFNADNEFIGQTRLLVYGLNHRYGRSGEWLSSGTDWVPEDPRYCLAILHLLKGVQKVRCSKCKKWKHPDEYKRKSGRGRDHETTANCATCREAMRRRTAKYQLKKGADHEEAGAHK